MTLSSAAFNYTPNTPDRKLKHYYRLKSRCKGDIVEETYNYDIIIAMICPLDRDKKDDDHVCLVIKVPM